ncbi:MAG: PASTA domain-containing protein [Anaerolineae bacterium]
MPRPFAVTATTNSVRLSVDGRSETSFTAFNASGCPIRGRAQLVPQDPQASDWLSLVGEAERDFDIAEAHQYTVRIDAPPDAPAGNYPFRLDMVGVEDPDEQYTQGPTVAFQVPEPKPEKPFPWWILTLIAAAVLLLGGGIAAIVFSSRDVEVPAVAGATISKATKMLTAADLEVGDNVMEEASDEVARGLVIRTEPPAGEEVPRGSDVILVVSTGPVPVTPTPTPTATPMPTATPIPTATPTPTATPEPRPVSIEGPHCARSFQESWRISKDVEIAGGSVLTLTVGYQAGTPYGWGDLEIDDPTLLQQVDHQDIWPAEGHEAVPGAPGTKIWVFRARGTGETQVTLDCLFLAREPNGTFVLNVTVY